MSRFLRLCLGAGLVFLYGPIVILVITSFNAARLTTVWTGFSLRWYAALAADQALIDAALLSLRVGVLAASLATLLGGLAGYALARFARFRMRTVFIALLAAPLVLPELLIGLALLLLFVALEQAFGLGARGATTITLAHATIGLSFVAITVQARLAATDASLEDAASDLGAPPWTAFRRITLPLIAPALVAGWLLAFTLSLDDLVVASFVSGPGASTLPMVVFSTLHLGVTPVLNALATVVLGVVAIVTVVATKQGRSSFLQKRSKKLYPGASRDR